jgi:4-diphosphocytidyl-2-C-methyl-D-erythritol kinase
MIGFPAAKINIGLRIAEKRPDGYHNIETVFYPTGFSDAIEFVIREDQTSGDSLTSSGIDTGVPPEENLVMKAIVLLRKSHNFPYISIHLHKAIPSGAGLGGGSSDASFILKSLNRFFALGISDDSLKSLALELGSDCPFFINNTPSFATGKGEILKSVPVLPEGYYLVLLNPGVKIVTAEAYRNCVPSKPSESLSSLILQPVNQWKNNIFNDFEAYAFSRHPLIKELKNKLYASGALFSLMSGSGSTVYGIYDKKIQLPADIKKYKIFEGRM